MLAALVLALLLPFTILKDDQGKTLMSFSDIGLPDFNLPGMSSFSSNKLTPSGSGLGGKDIFYRWYDADGNVQFTTEPPPDGIEYTVKGYDPNANVIRAVKMPAGETAANEPAANEPAPTGETANAPPEMNPYDTESTKKLFEDTKNIEKLLNQRLEDQNSNLNQ
ncbi:MAG: DUF4124 domain-containing protein [Gammaproteobacteria bacterium]|nr:DUF4124 domain-containing protein [Gammaproteobacteria bacterium]